MPVHPNVKSCTHVKVTGLPCGSPALRGEQFCYFHQRMVRGVKTPPQSRLHPIALIEDKEALQASLMEIINALARNTIDLRRAELILRALHIAVKNVHRVQFGIQTASMINEVPDYPATSKTDSVKNEPKPPAAPKPVATPAVASDHVGTAAAPEPALSTQKNPSSDHVGTAALGRPGGADLSRRNAPIPSIQKKPSSSVKRPIKIAPRAASRGS